MGKLIETVIVEEPQARGLIETEVYELAEIAQKVLYGLCKLSMDGKISKEYLSMLGLFAHTLDDMAQKFIYSDDGWGNNFTTEHDLKELQSEREQVVDRLRQIDGWLADLENDKPAS